MYGMHCMYCTYPLPDKNIMYNRSSTEYDANTDNDGCHDGGGRVEVNKREQNNS